MKTRNTLRLEPLEGREVPTGDLIFASHLTGVPASSITRIAADAAGNSYVAGTFTGTIDVNPGEAVTNLVSKGGKDAFVAKYGLNGQLLWAKAIGGTGDDTATDVAFDGAGNVFAVGNFNGTVDFNPDAAATLNLTAATGGSAYVVKFAQNGNFFLARAVGGQSTATSLAVDPNGSMFLTGQFFGTADFNPSPTVADKLATTVPTGAAYVWRIDATGNHVWAKAYHSTYLMQTTAIAVDAAGNVYTSGRATGIADLDPGAGILKVDAGGTWTPFVSKLGFNGQNVWGRAATVVASVPSAQNMITGLGFDGAGNVLAAGTFAGTLDFNPDPKVNGHQTSVGGSVDAFVWKLSTLGNFMWTRTFGGVNTETLADLSVDRMGNSFITGNFTGTVDFDPAPGLDHAVYLVSGTSATAAYVSKLDPLGNLTYARSLGGGISTLKATGIWNDGAGNVYTTGTFSGLADLDPEEGILPIDGGTSSGYVVKLSPPFIPSPTPPNVSPNNRSAGGPYTINEGAGLVLRAGAADIDRDRLTFTWDLNGDGTFGDAVGFNPTLTPAQMAALGLNDSRNLIPIRVRISDGVNLPVEAVSILTIKNVAPSMTLSAPARAGEGTSPIVGVATATDPSLADRVAGFRYAYDFGNNGTWDVGDGRSYAGGVAQTQAAVPASFTNGVKSLRVRVRILDKDGGIRDSVVTIQVNNVAPTAKFVQLDDATVGGLTRFEFQDVNDAPSDIAAGLYYGFDFNNDGQYEILTRDARSSTVFSAKGTYTVRGIVIDQDGGYNQYALTVKVLS